MGQIGAAPRTEPRLLGFLGPSHKQLSAGRAAADLRCLPATSSAVPPVPGIVLGVVRADLHLARPGRVVPPCPAPGRLSLIRVLHARWAVTRFADCGYRTRCAGYQRVMPPVVSFRISGGRPLSGSPTKRTLSARWTEPFLSFSSCERVPGC